MRRGEKWLVLTSLYLSQGVPYGFFHIAVPVLLRSAHVSLEQIGFSSLLALPWALKFLWAPLVDQHQGSPLGARRGWIVPLQLAAVVVLVGLAFMGGDAKADSMDQLRLMMGAVLVTNFFAATQDIATDALAIDVLEEHERGHGNGIQVAAYRVGMVLGGGVLVGVYDVDGWRVAFLYMAAVLFLATIPVLFFREPKRAVGRPANTTVDDDKEQKSEANEKKPTTIRSLLASPLENLRLLLRPGVALWLFFLVVYRFGDALCGGMARVMLVDHGVSLARIGEIFGTWGSSAGLVGAMTGGWLAQRLGRARALLLCGALHSVLLASYALPAAHAVDVDGLWVLAIVEHLTGGMATVALFTLMMDASDPKTGATDYTVQASVVVLASGIGAALSGISAHQLGYTAHFVLSGLLSLAGVVATVSWVQNGKTVPERVRRAVRPSHLGAADVA